MCRTDLQVEAAIRDIVGWVTRVHTVVLGGYPPRLAEFCRFFSLVTDFQVKIDIKSECGNATTVGRSGMFFPIKFCFFLVGVVLQKLYKRQWIEINRIDCFEKQLFSSLAKVQVLQSKAESLNSAHGHRKGFFQGGPLGDFSKIFPGEAKSDEICFFPKRNYENNHFCWNFQNPGGKGFPCPPSDGHDSGTSRKCPYTFSKKSAKS